MPASKERRAQLRKILVIVTLATLPLYCLGFFVMQRAQAQLKVKIPTTNPSRVETLQIFPTATDAPGLSGSAATLPAASPTLSTVPEEFLRQYFQLIDQRDYSQTWAMLSEHYRQVHNASGYQPYVDFWNTVASLSMVNAQTVSQDQQSVKLQVQVSFIFTNGKSSTQTITFSLVSDAATGSWLIDDTY
jgi:hypothetical protein